ncbi:MAG: diguanylate cyclase [Cyanobacteria bacterium P01_E01_bin.45]
MLENTAKLLQVPLLTLPPSQTVAAAVSQMVGNRMSFVLVLDEDGLKGIFTERDIVRLISSEQDLHNLTLSDAMTRNTIVIRDSEIGDIFQVSKLFREQGVRHIPVVDCTEKLLGVLTPQSISDSMTPEHFLRNIRTKDALISTIVEGQAGESVLQIAQRMTDLAVSCITITDPATHHPLGIITERDIAQFHTLGLDIAETQARTVMSQPLFTVQQDELLWSVLEIMRHRHIRRLVVVQPTGEIAGLVHQTDILKLLNPAEMYRILEQMQATIDRQTEQLRKLNRTLLMVNDDLHRKASFDGLTQLSNRRSFDDYLVQVWEWLSGEQGELTLMICDVDFFKIYNDLYGHMAGDTCLKLIADSLKQVVRSSTDMVARYGGEEFAIILPKCGFEGAERAAQTIRRHLQQLDITHNGSSVSDRISVSIGAATVALPSANSPTHLLKLSDDKLYEAKRLGRDRACFGRLD